MLEYYLKRHIKETHNALGRDSACSYISLYNILTGTMGLFKVR